MRDINIPLDRKRAVKLVLAVVVIAVLLWLFFPRPKELFANDTLELCARQDGYDAQAECTKYMLFKYPGKQCTGRFTDSIDTGFGVCTNCIIECYR